MEEQKIQNTLNENSNVQNVTNVEKNGERLEESSYKDSAEKDLDFILDIPLEISVELGRTKMIINDLLKLGQGAVVELSKMADAPMDVYVNRKLFARGEVVVVNEKFGIRLTDIISPIERVKTLG